jgi:glycosyltransferase involved in cell wall biosynthesis
MPEHSPLILHTECSDGWGGQEIRIMEELRGMRRYGYATALIAPQHSRIFSRAQEEGFAVYPVRFGSKGHFPSWVRLFRLIAQLRPDVVNTHSSDDSWMAGFVARALGVPLLVRTRHVSTPIGSAFSYKAFPHRILTTSQAIRESLIACGIHEERIVAVPTGIDSNRFRFSSSWRKEIREKYGFSEEDILVGNICVLRSWKGLDFFIDTAAQMPPRFKFILVGDGPQRSRLQDKARGMGLEGRMVFPGHQEEIEKYFSALDLYFFTSYANEGVPQSLLQAQSVGLPMVVCRTPSVLETLQSAEDVIPVEYGEVPSACGALEKAGQMIRISDDRRKEKNERVRSTHSLEAMLGKIRELYGQWGIGAPAVPQDSHGVTHEDHGEPRELIRERTVEGSGHDRDDESAKRGNP